MSIPIEIKVFVLCTVFINLIWHESCGSLQTGLILQVNELYSYTNIYI